MRLILSILMLTLAGGSPVSAQYCRVTAQMINADRHVVGEVNAECAPSWHSTTWGNWGVAQSAVGVEYLDSSSCRVTFDPRAPLQMTNDRGEYVLRDVDARREFQIVARHPQRGEQIANKEEITVGDPAVRSRQFDFVLKNP